MSTAILDAKSGLDWTQAELRHYKIQFDVIPGERFFGPEANLETTDLGHLDPSLLCFNATRPLTTTTRPLAAGKTFSLTPQITVEGGSGGGASSALTSKLSSASSSVSVDEFSEETFYLLSYLRLASWGGIAQESGIEDFARELLRTFGFQTRHSLFHTRYPIPFVVAGKSLRAQSDLCLVGTDDNMIRLLLQKERPLADESDVRIDPEPQLVAAAIAAFTANNEARAEKCKAALDTMVFPAIVMVRSCPKFYIIPVTKALSLSVAEGTSPEVETHISMCTVPSPYSTDCGMEAPKYRAIALRYLIAFKAVAEGLWSNY